MINLSRRTIKTIELLNNFEQQITNEVMPHININDKRLFEIFNRGLKESVRLYSSGMGKLAQDKLNLIRHFANDSLPIFEYPKFLALYNQFEDDLKILR